MSSGSGGRSPCTQDPVGAALDASPSQGGVLGKEGVFVPTVPNSGSQETAAAADASTGMVEATPSHFWGPALRSSTPGCTVNSAVSRRLLQT